MIHDASECSSGSGSSSISCARAQQQTALAKALFEIDFVVLFRRRAKASFDLNILVLVLVRYAKESNRDLLRYEHVASSSCVRIEECMFIIYRMPVHATRRMTQLANLSIDPPPKMVTIFWGGLFVFPSHLCSSLFAPYFISGFY